MISWLPPTLFAMLIAACLVGVTPQSSAAQTPATGQPTKVLFIGNSYTYYNNLPQIVTAFAAAAQRAMITKEQTVGGASLEKLWHLRTTQPLLTEEKWQVVVLQEQSLRPIVSSERMLASIRTFDAAIKSNGAKTILYLTWARRGAPEDQKALNEAYAKSAKAVDALIAPVGPAWRIALDTHPQMILYANDGSHPSPLGSYITACTLFLVIAQSQEACPALDLPGVDSTDARVARDAALQAVQDWRNR